MIPNLSETERVEGLRLANLSSRKRYAKILHQPGAYFNQVFNFIVRGSYMQPHQHPSAEKIEEIHIVEGKIKILFFDDAGAVTSKQQLGVDINRVTVPAFTWHTYVVLTDFAITYETMNGIYTPVTWKRFAQWSPSEVADNAPKYCHQLGIL